jgi:hypothetical protein
MAREATVEEVDQELGLARLGLEFVPGQAVSIVEPFSRLRKQDAGP